MTGTSVGDPKANEARLRAVRETGLVDGARSTVLDALCRVATRTIGVPTALVTLLDRDRQHIPGSEGLERIDGPTASLPLTHAICRALLDEGRLLAIDDTRMHPEWRDTPPVTIHGIHAYLGVALTDDRDQVLGALCVIDTLPRQWRPEDVAVLQDLAHAARAELLRRRTEERYELAIDATAEVIYAIDPASGDVWRAGALQRIYGRSPAELDAGGFAAWLESLHPDDRARVLQSWEETTSRSSRTSWEEEYRIQHPDGAVVAVRDRARITRDANGRPVRIAGAIADVTVERHALAELQASDTRFRTTLEALHEGVLLQDGRDRIHLSNAAAARTLGLTEDQLYGRTSFDPGWYAIREDGTPFDPAEHPSVVAMRTNQAQSNVLMGVGKPDGSRVWISIDAEPIRLPGEEQASSVVVTFRDVTHERETARELASLASIVASSPYPVISTSTDGTIRTWNASAERFFGKSRESMVGCPYHETLPLEERDAELALLARAATGETLGEYESLRRRADGTLANVLVGYAPVRGDDGQVLEIAILVRDISATRQLEAELRQSQKLEAMGRLAGGVAHDFNNLLTVIRGSAELLRMGVAPRETMLDDLEDILRTVDRASGLTRQLLAFSRKQVIDRRTLSMNEVVQGTSTMLRRVIGDDVRLTFEPARGDPLVSADRGQLEQILLNLVVNARDAMPDGGTIQIAVTAGSGGRPPRGAPQAPVFAAPHVTLSVRDSGIGMDELTRQNAFEPFFTTKEEGKGTGLGLSTVYGIATQNGGAAWIDSTLGAGATIFVTLPATGEAAAALPEEGRAPEGGRRGTILIVEDEPGVREITTRLLQQFGYDVVAESTVPGAKATLDRMLTAGERIDAIVTDVVMPEGGGASLIEHARRVRATLPILVVSGYAADARLTSICEGPHVAFLGKPFSARDLFDALAKLMR